MIKELLRLGFQKVMLDDDVHFQEYDSYPHILSLDLRSINLTLETDYLEEENKIIRISNYDKGEVIKKINFDNQKYVITDLINLNGRAHGIDCWVQKILREI